MGDIHLISLDAKMERIREIERAEANQVKQASSNASRNASVTPVYTTVNHAKLSLESVDNVLLKLQAFGLSIQRARSTHQMDNYDELKRDEQPVASIYPNASNLNLSSGLTTVTAADGLGFTGLIPTPIVHSSGAGSSISRNASAPEESKDTRASGRYSGSSLSTIKETTKPVSSYARSLLKQAKEEQKNVKELLDTKSQLNYTEKRDRGKHALLRYNSILRNVQHLGITV